MFGSKQNKEMAARIGEAVQPMIGHVHTAHGLPTGFWNDSYVLGYLMGQINAWMSVFDGDNFSIADKGRVLVEAFGLLSGQKGKPISENAMVCAQQGTPDFLRANQNGMFMAMYAAEKIPDADTIGAVLDAKSALAANGADPTTQAVTEHLVKLLWVEEVRTRFGGGG